MAQRGKGFDMRVLGLDPYCREPPPHVDELLPADGLPDLLRRADVVMIACAHTPETHHLLDAQALAADETHGLPDQRHPRRGGRRGGADRRPPQRRASPGRGWTYSRSSRCPTDSPLWELENVILTPHAAGRSQNRPRPTIELFCDNLRRYREGRALRNVVNKKLGF